MLVNVFEVLSLVVRGGGRGVVGSLEALVGVGKGWVVQAGPRGPFSRGKHREGVGGVDGSKIIKFRKSIKFIKTSGGGGSKQKRVKTGLNQELAVL